MSTCYPKGDPRWTPRFALRGFILGFTIAAAVGPISLLVIRRTLAEGRLVRPRLRARRRHRRRDVRRDRRVRPGRDHRRPRQRPAGARPGRRRLPALAGVADDPVSADRGGDGHRRGVGGYAGAYLSILGLTLANPMTILSFGALFAGLRRDARRDRRRGAGRPRRPARVDDVVGRPDDGDRRAADCG